MEARTISQSLRHIKKMYDAGKLGAGIRVGSGAVFCRYQYNRKFCSVGCLFTQAQLDDIKSRGLNDASVDDLVEEIGKDNIYHMTGMEVWQLREMQRAHDNSLRYASRWPEFGHWLEQQIRVYG